MNQNYLKLVGLCGADDKTSIDQLVKLCWIFPFLEVGILYHPEKEGQARAPSKEWRGCFLERQFIAGCEIKINRALHLCGDQVFRDILDGKPIPEEFNRYDWLQVNINARGPKFSIPEVIVVYGRLYQAHHGNLILQLHEQTELPIKMFLGALPGGGVPSIRLLSDTSRGKGIVPESWGWPAGFENYLVGQAGGFNPDNVVPIVEQLTLARRPFTIDMESGVRTDNEFDRAKAVKILSSLEHLICP